MPGNIFELGVELYETISLEIVREINGVHPVTPGVCFVAFVFKILDAGGNRVDAEGVDDDLVAPESLLSGYE